MSYMDEIEEIEKDKEKEKDKNEDNKLKKNLNEDAIRKKKSIAVVFKKLTILATCILFIINSIHPRKRHSSNFVF